MALVYLATNSDTGMEYVGVTIGTLAARRFAHERDAVTGRHNCRRFARALVAHGAASFDWEVLVDDLPYERALLWERLLIAQRGTKSPGGYNLCAGGRGAGSPSQETRDKRASTRAKTPWTAERAARHSAAVKATRSTPESREKTRRQALSCSPETRKKLSAAMRLRYEDENERRKTGEASRRAGADPARKATQSKKARENWADPALRERMERSIRDRQTPEYRAAYGAKISKLWEDPDFRSRVSAGIAASKRTPEGREKNRLAAVARWAKRKA